MEILVIVLNGALLIILTTSYSLRISTFHVYVVNVTLANFLHAILVDPFSIITDIHGGVWIFSYAVCSFYQFSLWILSAAMQNAHALITLNRLWAIIFPIHYRQTHRRTTAVLLCIGMWICILIILLPGMIPDATYYRLLMDRDVCRVNSAGQVDWSITSHFLAYGLAEFIIVIAYPFIVYAHCRRKKTTGTSAPTTRALPSATAAGQLPSQNKTRSSKRLHILTLLTVSVFICWTPGSVVYSILPFRNIDIPLFADLLFAFQAALDPVLFMVTLPELRQSARRLCCRGSVHPGA
ncbi:fMet-Leu-Phe receptor-like [Paramacrobiotus metropolitanus]|uniref:fMet-Leu-Phe receptor-like n=1 Tax=Paramacrobiotus metropolitanus TaxID=2943436 RepID=UPI0024463532|nr:fMet-Leu-Phe receptor-like [Paramacrobiotus metropolitanus]